MAAYRREGLDLSLSRIKADMRKVDGRAVGDGGDGDVWQFNSNYHGFRESPSWPSLL